ncbi:hypothetical protein N9C62_07480 [Luminiphilus sp.]|nr:hypothetical protein [Luminiphilus sp.]
MADRRKEYNRYGDDPKQPHHRPSLSDGTTADDRLYAVTGLA